jgi:L-2-hydroxyglutarate oxidase LhgO
MLPSATLSVSGSDVWIDRPKKRRNGRSRLVERERFLHLLNVPSPAATASLPIGREILKMVPPEITG